MNGLPYYKRYPRDFIEGTIGLPFELKVTYSFVLDLIYMQGGNLPDDPRYIAGLLGVSVRKWNGLRLRLIEAGKLQVNGELLTNYRALSELKSLRKFQDNQREKASKPRNANKLPDATAKPKPSQPEPEPDIEELTTVSSLSSGNDETKPIDEISEAVAMYNATAKASGWPGVRILSKARRSALAARLRECDGLGGWRAALEKAQASNHCCGQNQRGWVANFDFLTRQSSFVKLMEGNYDNRPSGGRSGPIGTGSAMADAFAEVGRRRSGG